MFLKKYDCLNRFDKYLNKIFIIDNEDIQYDKIMAGI